MHEPYAFTVGQFATLACLLEVAAPKPGNVHRGADFEDMGFQDFVVSATAIGPVMERAVQHGVGKTVLDAVAARRAWTAVNTNLGTVLLLAPLAAVPRNQSLTVGIASILNSLTPADAQAVYAAIRAATPGGLGRTDRFDVAHAAPPDLLEAMWAAADRDLVARQYVNQFATVFNDVVPNLMDGMQCGLDLPMAIVHTHVQLLATHGDSLIARKCGREIANTVKEKAARVLDAGPPHHAAYYAALADLDFWLRADHHRRNPGTTADLIAAGLFVALREQMLIPPLKGSGKSEIRSEKTE